MSARGSHPAARPPAIDPVLLLSLAVLALAVHVEAYPAATLAVMVPLVLLDLATAGAWGLVLGADGAEGGQHDRRGGR